MRPKIYAKGNFFKEFISIKHEIGCDGIEVALLDDLVDLELRAVRRAADVYDVKNVSKMNIKAVHIPMLSEVGLRDVNIESIPDNFYYNILRQVCIIANTAGEYNQENILIVIHCDYCLDELESMWHAILERMSILLDDFKWVEFAIENITPMEPRYGKDTVVLRSNVYDDSVLIAKALRHDLQTDRIGTVLDTCHVEITKSLYDMLKPKFSNIIKLKEYSMDKLFEINKDVIKLVHMSYTNGNGYGKGNHGVPFSDDSYYKMKEYMQLYRKYNYNVPITLEVAEEDYHKCEGYRKSYELMMRYLNEEEGQ